MPTRRDQPAVSTARFAASEDGIARSVGRDALPEHVRAVAVVKRSAASARTRKHPR